MSLKDQKPLITVGFILISLLGIAVLFQNCSVRRLDGAGIFGSENGNGVGNPAGDSAGGNQNPGDVVNPGDGGDGAGGGPAPGACMIVEESISLTNSTDLPASLPALQSVYGLVQNFTNTYLGD